MKGTARVGLMVLAVLLAGAMPASAHMRGRVFIGVGPVWGPAWWGPPAYYYTPPPVVVREEPAPVYVEPAPQPEKPAYWYYCRDPKGYYPYVRECPDGWKRVNPTPPKDVDEEY